MSQDTDVLSPRLLRRRYGTVVFHEHWCPGCDQMHQIAVEQPFPNGHRWTWDGNAAAPTFSPSVGIMQGTQWSCHYFVRGGRIEFCADSHHALASRCVELPDIPADWLD
jgi:hypothetical protein